MRLELNDAIIVRLVTSERMRAGVASQTDLDLARQAQFVLDLRFGEIVKSYFGAKLNEDQ